MLGGNSGSGGFLSWLKQVFTDNAKKGFKKIAPDKFLEITSETDVQVVDGNQVPVQVKEELKDEVDTGDFAEEIRGEVMEGRPPGEVAERAASNHYVLNDVVNNPDMVNADTPGEAVEAVAEADPGWASMTDVHAIAPDAEIDGGSGSSVDGVGQGEINTDTGDVDIDTGSGTGGDSGEGLGDGSLGDGQL